MKGGEMFSLSDIAAYNRKRNRELQEEIARLARERRKAKEGK
jgi:hypothetical protein